ncbi:hypothetical protein Tco_1374980 [Tanacetum coccineum]
MQTKYGSDDSDTNSDSASLDHLSEGEEVNNEDEGKHDCDPVFSKVGEDSQKEPKLGLDDDDDDDDDLGNLAFKDHKNASLAKLAKDVVG